ncbi:MAG TPA: helix-turn-helix domain-containing protein [Clostridia bacterium]|nr:helix-turn-helix domain-containing protein [Clostridia bacterium]
MANFLLNQSYYPKDYRKKDVEKIIGFLLSFQPVSIIGLPRVGLARILRFILTHPEFLCQKIESDKVLLIEIDLNDLFSRDEKGFWQLVLKRLSDKAEINKTQPLIKKLYVSAARANDSFTFFDNTKQSLKKICHEDYLVFLFFNRFDRSLPLFSYRFFAHLQSLKDVAKTRINFLFTSNRPLEYLSPDVFKGGNLEVFSQKYFLKPASKEDLAGSVIKEFEKSRKVRLSRAIKNLVYQYSGGHAQYALLVLQALEKQGFSLKKANQILNNNPNLLAQSQELWDFLDRKEKQLLLSKKRNFKDCFLVKIGLISEKGQVFSPVFEDFLRTQKEISVQELTRKEKALLTILQGQKGELVTREEIINFVWPENPEEVNEWTLDQLVKRLRKKLGDLKLPFQVKTIKAQGYSLIPS